MFERFYNMFRNRCGIAKNKLPEIVIRVPQLYVTNRHGDILAGEINIDIHVRVNGKEYHIQDNIFGKLSSLEERPYERRYLLKNYIQADIDSGGT